MAENTPEEHSLQMSFMQHLDALRWHLVRSAIAIFIFAVALFCFNNFLFDTVIFGPLKQDFISYRALCSLKIRTCKHFLLPNNFSHTCGSPY